MKKGSDHRELIRRTSYSHTVHGGNRVSVPSELREALTRLTGEAHSPIWASLAPYGAIVCLPRRWAEEGLAAAVRGWTDEGDDDLVTFGLHLFARAGVVTPDPSGRVSLPPHLCEWAEVGRDGRDVIWVGRGTWAELWSKPRFDANLATLADRSPAGLDWPDDVRRKLKRHFVQALSGLDR